MFVFNKSDASGSQIDQFEITGSTYEPKGDILLDGEKIAKKIDKLRKSLTLTDPNKGVEGVVFYSYISDKKPFCRALERRQFEKVICNSISTKQFFKPLEDTNESATYLLLTAIKNTKYFYAFLTLSLVFFHKDS